MKMFLNNGRQVSALTIAGSDSGGNAGIQADIRAFHTFGLHACTAITCLTAQNQFGVSGIEVPPPEFLRKQLEAVIPLYDIKALKTGMLANAEVVDCVAEFLSEHGEILKVIDPVMVATSGAKLISDDAIATLKASLLPLATIITPNIPEAEVLSGMKIESSYSVEYVAKFLADEYGCAVLVKGGHSTSHTAEDTLAIAGETTLFATPVVDNPASTHGTGCSLSAAITAALAMGKSLPEAVKLGKEYVYQAIKHSLHLSPQATVLGMPDL